MADPAFQNNAFQSDAFQSEQPVAGPAFQANAFQNDAFQATMPELGAALLAVESPDTASFEASAQEEEQGGWSEYIPPQKYARLSAVEPQDIARFSARFDYSDEELVMALMALDEEVTA